MQNVGRKQAGLIRDLKLNRTLSNSNRELKVFYTVFLLHFCVLEFSLLQVATPLLVLRKFYNMIATSIDPKENQHLIKMLP